MKKAIASVAALTVAGGIALTGCGTGGYPQATYCVDTVGHVLPDYDCQPGHFGYNPMYMLWVGSTHSHIYHTGQVIPRSYVRTGTRVSPTNSAARARLGIPTTGVVKSGYKPSTPAKPQTSVKAPTTTKSGSFTSRVTSGFKSTFKSGGSSFRSSGGRK